MSITVKVLKGSTTIYTFGTHAPFVSIRRTGVFNQADPPALIAIDKEWTIAGVVLGTETTVATAWAAFLAGLETTSNYPTAVQLLTGSTVIDELNATTHRLFKIEEIESPQSDPQWRGEFRFRVKVSARIRLFGAGVGTKVVETETYSYSDAGLLTHTLQGEIETDNQTSATAIAQTFGLSIPGSTFAYVTNGPGGVDVERLNQSDTSARYTSTVQESGSALPGQVSAGFSVPVEVGRGSGEITTTIRANAEGLGAESAVRAQRPARGLIAESVVVDKYGRKASATYTTRVQEDKNIVRTLEFSIKGGGAPIRYTRRTGRRSPIKHVLTLQEVEIVEVCTIEVIGDADDSDFKFPEPMDLDEDVPAGGFEPYPKRMGIGVARTGDKYAGTLKRVYRAATLKGLAAAIRQAAFYAKFNITPKDEIERRLELADVQDGKK